MNSPSLTSLLKFWWFPRCFCKILLQLYWNTEESLLVSWSWTVCWCCYLNKLSSRRRDHCIQTGTRTADFMRSASLLDHGFFSLLKSKIYLAGPQKFILKLAIGTLDIRSVVLPPSLNILRFDFFIPTLTICLI
jgi:hypothetical protein